MVDLKRMDKAYTEVYLFLDLLGEEYKNKLPNKIYEAIENNRDINYKPDIKEGNALSREALTIIAAFNLQYWCDDINEKNELKQQYVENAKKEKERLEQKVDYDAIFNRNKKEEVIEETVEEVQEETALVPEKENIFTKIKNFFAKLFNRTKE